MTGVEERSGFEGILVSFKPELQANMAERLYVDTSAYLCVLLGETGHAAIESEIAGAELYSSVLLVLETSRSLIRLSREKVLSSVELQEALARLEKDMESFQLRDLTMDLCVGRTMPVVSSPPSFELDRLGSSVGS